MKAFQFSNAVYIVTNLSKQWAKNKGEEDEGRGRHASKQKRNLKHNEKNGRIEENLVQSLYHTTLNEWPRFLPSKQNDPGGQQVQLKERNVQTSLGIALVALG